MRLCLCLLAVCVLPSLAAKDMIRTPLDVPMLGELEEYLAQNLLFNQKNRDAGLADINQKPGFKALIKKHKAYKSNGTFKRNQGENRSGMWEIRVPADQYADFLVAVKKLGVPEEVQENTRDVTAQYVDLEARIANQKRLEERILGVLDEVKGKINDVLQVEKELARVRETIERLEGQMRVLKDKVTMATLTVHVREDKDYVPPQALSFGDSIGDIWGKSIDALMAFAKGVVLVVVAIFPWLLVILPPLYILYRLVRRWIAKRFANTPPILAEEDKSA